MPNNQDTKKKQPRTVFHPAVRSIMTMLDATIAIEAEADRLAVDEFPRCALEIAEHAFCHGVLCGMPVRYRICEFDKWPRAACNATVRALVETAATWAPKPALEQLHTSAKQFSAEAAALLADIKAGHFDHDGEPVRAAVAEVR